MHSGETKRQAAGGLIQLRFRVNAWKVNLGDTLIMTGKYDIVWIVAAC